MAIDLKRKYLRELDMLGELVRHETHTQGAKRARGRQETAVDGHQCPDMEERGEEAQEVEVETTQAKELSRMWMKGQGPMMFLAQMVLVKVKLP